MKLAIGISAKRRHRDLGDNSLNKYGILSYVLDLEIGHYCYGGDDERTQQGFKFKQDYFLNGTNIKAVTKRFEEDVDANGNVNLHIYFDYFGWVYKDEDGNEHQDLIHTKKQTKIYAYGSKSLFDRRYNQRSQAINNLKTLGFKFESMSAHPLLSHLVGYNNRMIRIFTAFQLEVGRFVDTNSEDFKNNLLASLQGANLQLVEDLNILVPNGQNDDGSFVMIETWKGIYAVLQ